MLQRLDRERRVEIILAEIVPAERTDELGERLLEALRRPALGRSPATKYEIFLMYTLDYVVIFVN
jgi:hypothetical protein